MHFKIIVLGNEKQAKENELIPDFYENDFSFSIVLAISYTNPYFLKKVGHPLGAPLY
ncbi:MAG: hypothetical protein Kow0042_25480 [Calditrichia bacterium]